MGLEAWWRGGTKEEEKEEEEEEEKIPHMCESIGPKKAAAQKVLPKEPDG